MARAVFCGDLSLMRGRPHGTQRVTHPYGQVEGVAYHLIIGAAGVRTVKRYDV